jgi:hypothetical protein
MGLVDIVVDPNALERTALAQAEQLIDGSVKPKPRKLGWTDWFLEKTPVGRAIMFSQAGKKLQKATKGKYPAPPYILDCVRTGLESGHEAGSAMEAKLFGELSQTCARRAAWQWPISRMAASPPRRLAASPPFRLAACRLLIAVLPLAAARHELPTTWRPE